MEDISGESEHKERKRDKKYMSKQPDYNQFFNQPTGSDESYDILFGE